MARQTLNVGTNANDGSGDTLRAAMIKVNEMFTEVYSAPGISSDAILISGNEIKTIRSDDDLIFSPSGTGSITFPALRFNDNNIEGTRSNEDLNITASGTGNIVVGALRINGTTITSDDSTAINFAEGNITMGSINITGNVITSTDSTEISFGWQQLSGIAQPTQATDAATKSYVDSSGNNFGNLEIVNNTLQNIVTNSNLILDAVGTGNIQIMSHTEIGSGQVTVTHSNTTEMNSFLAATYRSAKYLVSITDTTNSRYEVVELLVTHGPSGDSTTEAFITAYGRAGNTTSDLATFTADVKNESVRVLVTNAAGSSTTYKFFKTLIQA